jgi:hypothetical protein
MEGEAFVPGESKRVTMDQAIKSFLREKGNTRPDDSFALIAYHNEATVCCPLTRIFTGMRTIKKALVAMSKLPSGGTEIYTGLLEAEKLVEGMLDQPDVQLRILAYSDGFDGGNRKALGIANKLKRAGVIIETFGVAISPSQVDEKFLRKIATTDPNGFVHYRFLGDAETIQDTFNEIAHGTLTVD